MIFFEKPENFNSIFDIVSCFVMVDGKFVLLKQLENKSQGGKWGLPTGKVDSGETLEKAVNREVLEETGLSLNITEEDFQYTVFVRHDSDGKEFTFHIFLKTLTSLPEIKINPNEHSEFQFVNPEESLKLDYVGDLDHCVNLVFKDSLN